MESSESSGGRKTSIMFSKKLCLMMANSAFSVQDSLLSDESLSRFVDDSGDGKLQAVHNKKLRHLRIKTDLNSEKFLEILKFQAERGFLNNEGRDVKYRESQESIYALLQKIEVSFI